MTQKLAILILLFLLYTSCAKLGIHRKLEGHVLFKSTGNPVPNATINLRESNNGNGYYLSLGTAKTDSLGHFVILYNRGVGDNWLLIIRKDTLGLDTNVSLRSKFLEIGL